MQDFIRKHDIYIAPFIFDGEDEIGNPLPVYDEPYIIQGVTLNSLRSRFDLDTLDYGNKANLYVQAILDYEQVIDKINEGDLAYLYGASPKGEENNGDKANFSVYAILPQNFKACVIFEKLPKT